MEKSVIEKVEHKTFRKPDEVREIPDGRVEIVNIGGSVIGRAIFQPGWKWSNSEKPIAKTKSCQAPHFMYHVSGVLRIQPDNGPAFDCGPGDVSVVPPGHDAWVISKEPVVVVDFQGMRDYGREK